MAARRPKPAPDGDRMSDIPMTPMIDVVFQLLIFFMLSMHFKEIEGKLLSQLPKNKGPAPSTTILPNVEEIRIFVCCDPSRDLVAHAKRKTRHDAELESLEKKQRSETKSLQLNDECLATVMDLQGEILYETAIFPDKKAHNRVVYRRIAEKSKELYDLQPVVKGAERKTPVILDADSAVPYEHIVGIVNACTEAGLENIEFVASPRHKKK